MNNPKLSVIIPVYKVEQYLHECVDSVLNQTYKDFEIILVDDGSPDRCPEICDNYAKKFKNIKVIHKENGGISSARNVGLDVAIGEFISFVDSDDYIEKDMFQHMIENQEKNNADIVICGRYYLYGEKKVYKSLSNVYKVMNSEEAIALMNINILGYYDVAPWDKIYRKSLFKNIRYPLGKTSEDWYITYKVFNNSTTIVYDSTPKYIYRQRDWSITHSKKVTYFPIEASQEILDFVKKNSPNYLAEAEFAYVFASIGVIDNLIEQENINRKEIMRIRKNIKPYLKNVIHYHGLKGKRKIQVLLVNYCINLYIAIFTKVKSICK